MSWAIFDVVEKVRAFGRRREFKLAEAIATGDLVTSEKLLKKEIDPNARVLGRNREPLIFLVYQKEWFTLPEGLYGDRARTSYRITARTDCLRLLLEYGADANVRDSLGRTLLEIAIVWCLPEVVKLLLANGADPNLRDGRGLTSLMKAARLGVRDARPMEDKLRIMLYLLAGGAEIDARSADGKTALMYGVGNSRVEVVEFLIGHGASSSITDRQGRQAADIISQSIGQMQHSRLRQILTQPQANLARDRYQQLIPEGDRPLASTTDNCGSYQNL